MRKVTILKVDLLHALEQNRKKHIAEYNEAVAGYKDEAYKTLEKKFVKAKQDLDRSMGLISQQIERFDPEDNELQDIITLIHGITINLKVPKSREYDYDVAIKMAEMEVNDNIELTQSEFQCFVMDDWDWKDDFTNTTKLYNAK